MNGFDLILPFLRPIQHLILDPEISEIMVNGSERVFIERQGHLEEIPGLTLRLKSLEIAVRNIARRLGDDISEEKPILDSRLPDGSRVAAVVPCSFRGVVLTIRKFAKHFGIEDLVRIRTLTKELADRLKTVVVNHWNILIPGGTGTVRTTSVARVKLRELDSTSLGGLAFLSPRFLSLVTRPGYQYAGAQRGKPQMRR